MPRWSQSRSVYGPIGGKTRITPITISYPVQSFAIRSNKTVLSPTVSGGSGTKTYSVTSGSLPSTVTFNSATGTITGPSGDVWPLSPTKNTNSSGGVISADIIASSDGGYFVYGYYQTSVTFGATTLSVTGTAAFIAKLSNDGSWQWAVGSGAGVNGVGSIALTSDGGVVACGAFNSATVTFGTTTLTRTGTTNIFVAKISSSGTWQWALTNTGSGRAYSCAGVVVTSDGSIIVSGLFDTAAITIGTTNLPLSVTTNLFFAKISSSGVWQWAVTNTGSGIPNSTTTHLAATSDGGAIVCGSFRTANMVLGSLTVSVANTTATMFVAKISSSGTWQWAVANTGAGRAQVPLARTTSDDGALIHANFSTGNITLGSINLTLSGTNSNGFVAKISSAGVFQWAAQYTSTSSLTPIGLDICPDGSGVISGYFSGSSLTFGAYTAALAGVQTTFVAKVSSSGAWQWALANTNTGTSVLLNTNIQSTSDGGAIISGSLNAGTATFGSTTVSQNSTYVTPVIAKVSSTGSWFNSGNIAGFPAPLTITATDSSGSKSTSINLTIV